VADRCAHRAQAAGALRLNIENCRLKIESGFAGIFGRGIVSCSVAVGWLVTAIVLRLT